MHQVGPCRAGQDVIPFITGQVVKSVALAEGIILVDWDADF
jgi:ribosomal 30S subunit maturation factor RimM